MMGYWEREEEPVMAEEERAPSPPVAEEREVEPTFSGEAMPEAAAEPCVVPVEDECVDGYQLVVNGVMNKPLTVIGGAWATGSDEFGSYITQVGENKYLRWEHDCTGDFTSTMKLVVTGLCGSAASFEFKYNSVWPGRKGSCGGRLGFAGKKGGIFTDETSLFDGVTNCPGKVAPYGFVDGELMTFVVQRRGDDYTISVTTSAVGEKVVLTHTKAGDIQGLGLRPWRSTIRLYEWTVVEEETALTNEKLRDWVKRWCWPTAGHGDRKGLPDISTWNTSQVTDMSGLFGVAKGWMRGRPEFSSCVLPDSASSFNDDISAWDTSSVTRMDSMFLNQSSFNQSLSNWQVDKVTNMYSMFREAKSFNKPIGGWRVEQVTNMYCMFNGASSFNQPLSDWPVDNVTNMCNIFWDAKSFNQPIGGWRVDNVTSFQGMFNGAKSFNQPIGDWRVASATDMSWMFHRASAFNQPIGKWQVDNVTNMHKMFEGASSFNQPLSDWRVDSVTDMHKMFEGASSFNQPVGSWRVDNVTNMRNMFKDARTFDQPLGDWRVDKVTDMEQMFWGAKSFNQSIGGWRVDNVTDMSEMFYDASSFQFGWRIRKDCKTANIFTWSALPETRDKVPQPCCTIS